MTADLPDYDSLPPAPEGGRSGWGVFGADEALGIEVEAIPCQEGIAAIRAWAAVKKAAEAKAAAPPQEVPSTK